MRSEQFLDTNIFLRHLLGDDPAQSPRATAYFQAIDQGLRKVRISDIGVFEVVFTLERGYRRSKTEIQSAVLPLLELPGMLLPRECCFPESASFGKSFVYTSTRTSRLLMRIML
jgi:predicted nucleic-acid-binding protein